MAYPVGPSPSRALADAVYRLRSDISKHGLGSEWDVKKVEELLHNLVQILEAAVPANFSRFSSTELLLTDRLLQALRTELLLGSAPEKGSTSDVLEIVTAIEQAHQELQRGATQASLLSTLASLRGADLMVELAHDLRSPLTSILFLAEALRDGRSGELSDLQHEQLGIVHRAALTLVSMAGNIVEMARGEETLGEREPSEFSIAETFDAILDLTHPLVGNKDIVVRKSVGAPIRRKGFPVALTRVLLNLTTNAISFTERGFVEMAATELPDGRIEFSVRDSGKGIDVESFDGIFEPFRSNRAGAQVGTSHAGLGLAICRRLVRAMGGELKFESAVNRGTRFYFAIDLATV